MFPRQFASQFESQADCEYYLQSMVLQHWRRVALSTGESYAYDKLADWYLLGTNLAFNDSPLSHNRHGEMETRTAIELYSFFPPLSRRLASLLYAVGASQGSVQGLLQIGFINLIRPADDCVPYETQTSDEIVEECK